MGNYYRPWLEIKNQFWVIKNQINVDTQQNIPLLWDKKIMFNFQSANTMKVLARTNCSGGGGGGNNKNKKIRL